MSLEMGENDYYGQDISLIFSVPKLAEVCKTLIMLFLTLFTALQVVCGESKPFKDA